MKRLNPYLNNCSQLSKTNFRLFFPLTALKILARTKAMPAFFALSMEKIFPKNISNLFMSKHLLLLLACLYFQSLIGQTTHFKIYKGKHPIGAIKAQKMTVGTKTVYDVSSTASYRFILKYTRETDTKVTFEGDILESVDAKIFMNEDLKEHRITKKSNSSYQCEFKQGKINACPTNPINWSISMFYFKEPVNQTQVFVESFQQLCPIEQLEPHLYKVTLPQNRINHYVYKKGVLQEIRVFRKMINLVFKREV